MGVEKMLRIVDSMRRLPFRALMKIYGQTNAQVARRHYGDVSFDRGLAMVEASFYEDLQCGFFSIPHARYCLWLEEETPVSALRMEPWRDGVLLTALETAPDRRNKGYASALLRAVQAYAAEQGIYKLYSHIYNRNVASIHLHEKCGFRRISDTAAYLDGSVDRKGATYLVEI